MLGRRSVEVRADAMLAAAQSIDHLVTPILDASRSVSEMKRSTRRSPGPHHVEVSPWSLIDSNTIVALYDWNFIAYCRQCDRDVVVIRPKQVSFPPSHPAKRRT
jgi:hypothetical protein